MKRGWIVCFGYKPRSFATMNKLQNKLKKPNHSRAVGFFIFGLLFIFCLSLTLAENLYQYDSLQLQLVVNGEFNLMSTGTSPDVESAKVQLLLFPKDSFRQKILGFDTLGEKTEEDITFTWNNPSLGKTDFGFTSLVQTWNERIEIKDKINFPLTNEVNLNQYLLPTETIDSDNPKIIAKAAELAEGEDDVFTVAFNLANWVGENVKYDLNTLTASVSQKASWVLENKEGVCDELTNLFISMVRSLGIPAKFVSGMAYTNTNGAWGPHAWAEVYFPNKGWVPFDITYGQFGWIDPTHLKLMESLDSGDPSVKFAWKSYNVDFKADEIKLDTTLVKEGARIERLVEMTVTPLKNDVGPGSYVPIKINIKNLKDTYLPESLFVIKAPELTERNTKHVLLKPNQEKVLFWIVKIPDNVEKEYTYSTTFEVRDMFHEIASEKINYASNLKVISKEEENGIDVAKIIKRVSFLEEDGRRHVQKVFIVRFNPFRELGGDHSFSLAILDGEDTGIIITSLHTRDRTRVYMKDIKRGKSSFELSVDEKKALTGAQKSK